ncbi:hypothetical protein K440DRAFT_618692 [Wilcoxina mikolae CBS 423.85]|nr:hypothetical protein K440DRAFT_618692 [Wilcoxina mikolae CBS 423.85]
MAPKSNQVATSGRRSQQQQQQPGLISSVYKELRSPDNASLVKSVALFAVTVTFFQSSWSEFLVPVF